MGKGLNLIYGAVLVIIGLFSLPVFYNDLQADYTRLIITFSVGAMGILIILTKIVPYDPTGLAPGMAPQATGRFGAFVRKAIFGPLLILLAANSFYPEFLADYLNLIAIGTIGGSITLIFFGLIYVFAGSPSLNKSWSLSTN